MLFSEVHFDKYKINKKIERIVVLKSNPFNDVALILSNIRRVRLTR